MTKYIENSMVEPMDAICVLNDKYLNQGIHKGYVGVVVENLIEQRGYIFADFDNPFKLEYIAVQVEIKKEDFRVLGSSYEDKKIVKAYKNLFKG